MNCSAQPGLVNQGFRYWHRAPAGQADDRALLRKHYSEINFSICFLLEIPLKGFPFHMKLFENYDLTASCIGWTGRRRGLNLYADLTIISTTMISDKPLNSKNNLECHPLARYDIIFKHQGSY